MESKHAESSPRAVWKWHWAQRLPHRSPWAQHCRAPQALLPAPPPPGAALPCAPTCWVLGCIGRTCPLPRSHCHTPARPASCPGLLLGLPDFSQELPRAPCPSQLTPEPTTSIWCSGEVTANSNVRLGTTGSPGKHPVQTSQGVCPPPPRSRYRPRPSALQTAPAHLPLAGSQQRPAGTEGPGERRTGSKAPLTAVCTGPGDPQSSVCP